MKKLVGFIGGIHGVGKSTVCQYFSTNFGWKTVKQRRVLIEVGKAQGLEWPEVAKNHDELIGSVADRIVQILHQSNQGVLLVDCHYAIPASAAARPCTVNEKYIPNLDWRLVEKVRQEYKSKFILLEVEPGVALKRIGNRPEASHFKNTLEHFTDEAKAEKEMFYRLLSRFSVTSQEYLCLCLDATNSKQASLQIASFIQLE